jgi:hypothetical protein
MALDLPHLAPLPPCGWNSFDCFGSAVTEAEVLANAAVLARELRPAGFDLVVVDYCWSHPSPGACANPNQAEGSQPLLAIDLDHRLVPAPERFPSARDGAGFKPLADRIHALGLRFGIHIMRGFPRQALYPGFPARGSGLLPAQFTDPSSTCSWLNHMCGVRANAAGQAYYDSLFRLYAEWGVDYVKADDLGSPYHAAEIEMIDLARRRCGRPITLSLSPGPCPLERAEHLSRHAELWRVSPDFWDKWSDLHRAFSLAQAWQAQRAPGAWPDLDMLPLGRLSRRGPAGPERESHFTPAETRSLLALWGLFGSPLFLGGDLTLLSPELLALLRSPLLRELRQAAPARCLVHDDTRSVWRSEPAHGYPGFLAIFNLGELPAPSAPRPEWVPAGQRLLARDDWFPKGETPSPAAGILPPHEVAIHQLVPAETPRPAPAGRAPAHLARSA